MKGSNYILDHVNSLEYHFLKVSLNRGSTYIPLPDWLLHKKSTTNPFNDQDNRCFLYAIVIALNHQNIANNPQRIVNLIPFIAKYIWDDIDFPAGHKDYSAFEKNNTDIALNILFIEHNMKEIRQCYISKHTKTRNNHVNLLMITDGTGKSHYLAIKSISGLLRGITSNHNGAFYCLNCFHSYRTANKLNNHEDLYKNYDFCNLKLPKPEKRFLSSPSGKNSLKVPFMIYADLQCLLVKNKSNENLRIEEIHIPSGYSIVTCYSSDKSKNTLNYYQGEDCMEHFSRTLGNIFIKLINYKQKAMIPLTGDEKVMHDKQKVCFLCDKEFCVDKSNKKEYNKMCKVRDHCHFTGKYRGAAHSKCKFTI